MTDFERKTEKTGAGDQASQGDPLLELTRLLGTRNLAGKTRVNETETDATGGEKIEEEQKAGGQGGQEPDKGWVQGLSPQPAGISMTGSIFMGDYGAGSVMATLPVSAPMEIMPEEDPEWESAAGSYAEADLPFEHGASETSSGQDENLPDMADWGHPVWEKPAWEKIEPMGTGEAAWLPVADAADRAQMSSADEENYDDEQIFHALAGDLTAQGNEQDSEAVQNIIHEGEATAADPVIGQDWPEIVAPDIVRGDARQTHNPVPSSPLSDFSGGYFGYGQSVQIDVGMETIAPSRQDHTPQDTRPQNMQPQNTQPQDMQPRGPAIHNHISPSPDHRVFAPIVTPPQQEEAASHISATSITAHVEEDFPHLSSTHLSSSDPQEAFAETLHDFDLTIHPEKRRRRRRHHPSQQSVSPFPASLIVPPLIPLEETGEFDLPPIDDNTSSSLPDANDFSDNFSIRVAADHVAGENHFFASPLSQEALSQEAHDQQLMPPNEAAQSGLYDWSVPANERVKEAPKPVSSITTSRGSKFYALLLVVLLGLMGGGIYWLYDFYGASNGDPVLINSLPGAVKIRPETNAQSAMGEQDMAVYNQDSSDISQPSQEELLDGRETPVNLDQINPPFVAEEDVANPPFVNSQDNIAPDSVNRDFLDPVDATILAAIERALPLHIVPTVAIERDRQGNLSPIEHPPA